MSPIIFARLRIAKNQHRTIKVLLDSGASGTLISQEASKHLVKTIAPKGSWDTAAGVLQASQTAKIYFTLPEFYESKIIEWKAFIFSNKLKYDMIIGRDLLKQLKIKLDFETDKIYWADAHVPMKLPSCTKQDMYVQESKHLEDETNRIKNILEAKYEPADLNEIVNECKHLTITQRKSLLNLLNKHRDLFDGTLGKWKEEKLNIELKPGAQPFHSRAYPVPKLYEETLKLEVDRLCKIGVLKKVNRSEWAAPTFIIPKKDKTVRFISDFRELNKRIKRKPYPIPKIQDLLLKLEGFQYGTSLDLNMGYYHIELNPDSKKLCTIVLPWGKYEYQRLPMGLCNSPDIFQEKMSILMGDLEYVRAYIDDLLVLSKGSWEDHLNKLDEVLTRLNKAGLKVNAKKSFFGRAELEYLGYWITREGIQPLPKKVKSILNIKPPTKRKELRSFIGIVNYYRDMWVRRSEVLAPLNRLCSKKHKWKWTDIEQKAFDKMKKIISKEIMLVYPNFNETFEIHTDASKTQLGAVVSQKGKPIAFYSRKLSPAQTRYTTTERELLAIVETLKEFKNILLGHKIQVCTDH